MNNRTVEIGVGLFVALGIAALFMLAMQVSNLGMLSSSSDSYLLTAGFENIGGGPEYGDANQRRFADVSCTVRCRCQYSDDHHQ